MAANSVTGSFRGIEVSFTFSGPHIVMSVLNQAEEGRRLRVMYQQQPLGGRVNWTSFLLSAQTQNVVVPTEVIQSHRLAFYVDDHEPISTYTAKILEELKQIKEKGLLDNDLNDAVSDFDPLTNLQPDNKPLEAKNSTNGNASSSEDEISTEETALENIKLEEKSTVESDPLDAYIPEHGSESEQKITIPESQTTGPNEPPQANVNSDENNPSPQLDVAEEPIQENISEIDSVPQNNQAVDSVTSKRKAQYIGKYIPSITTDSQFKIKVPSLPKSASKKHATFIPAPTSSASKTNGKKHGFFGQLFGFSFQKSKKEYYQQQNRVLYEKFHSNLEKLESNYNNGYGISLDNWEYESLSEQQTAVLLLNLMVNEVREWKKAAKQGADTKETLAPKLEKIEEELKKTLKQTRGINAPSPTLFPDRIASSEQDLMDIQKDCDTYLQRFSDKLAMLEQKHAEKVKIPAFKRFLVEFVRDRLFPDVAEFSSLNSVRPRLNWFLDLVEYELIPIEPGKTKISLQSHEVKEKRKSDFESDTVVEVISPGLQSKDGQRVIQAAAVVQAE